MIKTKYNTPIEILGKHPQFDENNYIFIVVVGDHRQIGRWYKANKLKSSKAGEISQALAKAPVLKGSINER